jgi:monovalent cation/proton antiporter MnhG/PhaG subunit
MTIVASVLLLAGAALVLVAAIGVWRFPEVVSRLHAATKAASAGIVLILIGAGAELGPGPFAFAVLVATFHLLTAPIAGHALARAARPEPEAAPDHPLATIPFAARVAGLAAVWMALWGDITAGNVVGGLLVGALVAAATGRGAATPFRLRPVAAVRFGLAFLWLFVRSTASVVAAALGPSRLVDPVVAELPLPPASIPALVATANAVSLTPGTVTLAVDAAAPALTIHLIRPDDDALAAIRALHARAAAALPDVAPAPSR